MSNPDAYVIHTLLYDPLTLDLGSVVFGSTTGYEVADLFIENGGVLCGDLDINGAHVTVEECTTCDADAGALIADATPVCLVGGSADISATPDGNAMVLVGYELVYVLTQGPGLTIIGTNTAPAFTVNTA